MLAAQQLPVQRQVCSAVLPSSEPHLVNVHHHHFFDTLVPEDLSGCGTLPAYSSDGNPYSGFIQMRLIRILRQATEPLPGSMQLRCKPGPTMDWYLL